MTRMAFGRNPRKATPPQAAGSAVNDTALQRYSALMFPQLDGCKSMGLQNPNSQTHSTQQIPSDIDTPGQ
jgi:hypothetical protein